MRRFLPCRIYGLPLLALTLSMVPALAAANDAIEPVAREGVQLERHHKINARAKEGHVDLLFLGDSITQGWNDNGVWQRYYGNRKAMNAGIGGDRTQHILWRLDNGNVDGLAPKLAVVMIGTNNVRINAPEETAAGIEAIVKKLGETLPNTKVLLLAVFPRGADSSDELRKKNVAVNEMIKKLADGQRVHYLDIGSRFVKRDGTLSKEIMPDLLHLSEKGYRIWAEAIEPQVAALLGDKAVEPSATSGRAGDNTPPEGYVALFNGKDLTGWKGLVASPPVRHKMTADELAAAQKQADADTLPHWSVEDGVIVFDGTRIKGKHIALCTAKDYGDFEMLVDWKIEPLSDSGIYLRGTPQIQIWDTAEHAEGSGGVFNNKINPKDPSVCADRPVGDWNTFHIRMVGDRVTVHLNGQLVVDNVVMENYWERDKPIYPKEQLELQDHGTKLYFKNIYVKEL